MPGIYPLKGSVKHYDWGGYTFIPDLLKLENKDHKPFAEYWMGIHPQGQSQLEDENGEWKGMSSFITGLPFLFKVLDVRDMLSIQVHPSKQAAEKEFARENAEKIPIDSPQRNYKDDNHKPELMVALGDFWLLHGFKSSKDLVYTLLNVVELRELLPIFNQAGYPGLYEHIMEMPQEEVNRLLQPLIDNVCSIYNEGKQDGVDEDYWAAKAAKHFVKVGNIDRGIFSIYLLNLVHLKKGEGIFQAAGVPHAYLEGQNVEIMANSDNVLRGGLTTKHIDVKELMKHVKCEATNPEILYPKINNAGVKSYQTPVSDFELGVLDLKDKEERSFSVTNDEILLVTEGAVELSGGNKKLLLQAGSPATFVEAGQEIRVKALTNSNLFRASTPL